MFSSLAVSCMLLIVVVIPVKCRPTLQKFMCNKNTLCYFTEDFSFTSMVPGPGGRARMKMVWPRAYLVYS